MRYLSGLLCACTLGVVVGCSGSTGDGGTGGSGGGMAGSGGTGARLSVGGTVTGLTGGRLVLQNNGADDLPIVSDGAFTFATPLSDGSNYLVTVFSQPTSPKQFCSIANGSGTLAGADVSNVAVSCDSGPIVSGFARFRDEDGDGTASAADVLIVPFDIDVSVNDAGATDFRLPVSGDSLGSGATVSAGPTSFDVTITLGTGATLRTRGTFDPAKVVAGSPSGIDVSDSLAADAIEGTDGTDAIPSIPINLIPEFVDTEQSLDPDDQTTELALGDVDGDDDLDLVKVNTFGTSRVYRNDGDGRFADSGQTLGAVLDLSHAVALGDLDDDDDLDIVIGNNGGPTRVYLNNGAGVFSDSDQELGVDGDTTDAVVLGDIDDDGDLDLLIGNLTAPNRVFVNDGEGVFTDSSQALGGSNMTWTLALGDLDGDDDLDLIEGNGGAVGEHPNRVYFNDGTGAFADSGQSLGVATTLDLALGDVDGDGDLDLVAGNSGSALGSRLYTNDGTGTFTDSGHDFVQGSLLTSSLHLRDVDDDGDLDLVFGNVSETIVWINDGGGSFAYSGSQIPSANSQSTALGDLDRDGDLDLVVGNGLAGSPGPGTRIYTGSLTDR